MESSKPSNLEPCPFCGCCETDDEPMHHTLDCYFTLLGLTTFLPIKFSQDELRKAWNTRYEQTCSFSEEDEYGNRYCSSCGFTSNYIPIGVRYCPRCGTKVVK